MHSFYLSAGWAPAARAVVLLAALAAGRAWGQQETTPAAQALVNWLQCEYCEHDELAAVTHYGQAVVPDLIVALNQGLSPESRDDLGRTLEERYAQLVEQSKKNPHAPIGVSKEKFVELYRGIWDVQHRVRATQALAAIGGERARAALEAAASQAHRDEVRAAARDSLRKLIR
jgi:hypothetical protein